MSSEVLIGTASLFEYSLFLGISIGLVIIVFAIMLRPKRGDAYTRR